MSFFLLQNLMFGHKYVRILKGSHVYRTAGFINRATPKGSNSFHYLCYMLYPSQLESRLGFDQIRTMVQQACLSSLGRKNVEDMEFLTEVEPVDLALRQIAEFRQIIENSESFPAQDYFDMIPLLDHLRIPGTWPEPDQLAELRLSLMTIRDIHAFTKKNKQKYPLLAACMESPATTLDIPPKHITSINAILDEKTRIRDSASSQLKQIRKEKAAKQSSVERKIIHTLKTARQNGWTPEDAEVTIRNGRLVIPILSAYKRKITGFVLDESATGQTIFLEPADLFETNNEIRELDHQEKREIIRILTAFADNLRPDIDSLKEEYRMLGEVDFHRAKALFSLEVGGILPQIGHETNWKGAIHPLLLLSHRKLGKPVVPLDIELTSENRILVLSGPNAGGKSVCLKTVGLLQYMLQCGLLPPVREDSCFYVFKKIFLDIGDDQSIDNDLSTYTSRLINLKYFLEHLDDQSLFLIDEFGSGTDPSLGAAIAEASLEHIADQGCYGIVTTHYSNLKLLSGKVNGIINGAMLFDSQHMRPMYKLHIGTPGGSFAFEIARNIGFPRQVLKQAKKKTGHSQLNFDRQIQDLEVEKQQIEKKSTELMVADAFIGDLIRKYEKMKTELEQSRKEILDKARLEAQHIISEANRMIEKTIKEIREAQAEKERTKKARSELQKFNAQLDHSSLSDHPESQRNKSSITPSTNVPSPSYQVYLDELNEKLTHFQSMLDIRGKRADEAYKMIQRYLDDAIVLAIPEVRILHGKGNGILRQVTRDYVRSVKEVGMVKDEEIERGGSGITVIRFK